MSRHLALMAAAAALVLTSNAALASPDLTLAAYSARASIVCSDLTAQIKKEPRVAPDELTAVARVASLSLAAVVVANKRLAAIPLPQATQRPLVVEWLQARAGLLPLFREWIRAAQARNTALAVHDYHIVANQFYYEASLAHVIGIAACSSY